jgi:hypothetical protein
VRKDIKSRIHSSCSIVQSSLSRPWSVTHHYLLRKPITIINI